MAAAEITLDELIAEYDRLGIGSEPQDVGMATEEWAALWGKSKWQTLRLLHQFDAAGWVTMYRKTLRGLGGIKKSVASYKIHLPQTKQTKRKK